MELDLQLLDIDTLTNMLLNELINLPSFNLPSFDLTTSYETFINSTFNEKQLYKQVICDDELTKISNKKIKYTKSENSNTLCPITQMEFEEQQDIIQLDCNHCFDPEAILYWLKEEKAECPVCRFKYKSIEVNEVNEVIENNDLHRSRENLYTSLMRVHFF
jgi:hypothetical protein